MVGIAFSGVSSGAVKLSCKSGKSGSLPGSVYWCTASGCTTSGYNDHSRFLR